MAASRSVEARGWFSWPLFLSLRKKLGERDRWWGENDRQDKGHSTWRWARAESHGGSGGERGWESSTSACELMCVYGGEKKSKLTKCSPRAKMGLWWKLVQVVKQIQKSNGTLCVEGIILKEEPWGFYQGRATDDTSLFIRTELFQNKYLIIFWYESF